MHNLREFLKSKKIEVAYVFGSFLRRRRIRDLDLAIYFAPRSNELLKLNAELEMELRMPVDVVLLHDLNPAFRLDVILNGFPLILNEELHHQLLSQTFSELLDFRTALEYVKSYKEKKVRKTK